MTWRRRSWSLRYARNRHRVLLLLLLLLVLQDLRGAFYDAGRGVASARCQIVCEARSRYVMWCDV